MSRRLRLSGLLISGILVVVAGYPWRDVTEHTHWAKVGWMPFLSKPLEMADVAGNLLLCAPLGVFAGLSFKRGALVAGAMALALSLFVEMMQLYSHSRFPSATDVVCNVAGAVLGAAFVRGCRIYASRQAVS